MSETKPTRSKEPLTQVKRIYIEDFHGDIGGLYDIEVKKIKYPRPPEPDSVVEIEYHE